MGETPSKDIKKSALTRAASLPAAPALRSALASVGGAPLSIMREEGFAVDGRPA
jgi:hypothetical protein